MKVEQINSVLRDLFKKFVSDGYKLHTLCSVTLGSQSNPQFNKFLEGTDIGIAPLSRMVSGMGYELHLVPINPENTELKKNIENMTQEFFKTAESDLHDYLENRPKQTRTGTGKVDQAFQDECEVIIKELNE